MIPKRVQGALGFAFVVAIAAFVFAAPWRGSLTSAACTELTSEIDAVSGGHFWQRVSDSFVVDELTGSWGARAEMERGDFRGGLTLQELRACLGAGWTETHADARGQHQGDAWAFVRRGGPVVTYVQSLGFNRDHVMHKIIITKINSTR